MKLKYIFAALVATLAIATGCQKENTVHELEGFKVDNSSVVIPMSGGSASITFTANDAWEFLNYVTEKKETKQLPSWLTASAMAGPAGSNTVTFTAESTLDGRTANLAIKCGTETQYINVIQGVATVAKATCAEVIAGPDSKSYLVTGICTGIANTSYGNWYLNDGTGEIYIYGTVDASGSYNWSKFNIEVGDEVTVQGPKTTYNGTVELVDAAFVSVNKSLIKVEEIDPEDATAPADGGLIKVTLANKGQGLYVSVPDDAADWLSLYSVEGNTVVFKAAENNGKARSTTVTFETKQSGKTYSAQTVLSQMGRTGTAALPYSVAEAIEFCGGLTAPTTIDFYVSGVISKIVYTFSEQYGTATFWMSDTGEYYGDTTKDFEAYSVYWFGKEPWADGDEQIEVGANVVVVGQLTNYKGTAETNSKAAGIYKINGQTNSDNGLGLSACPLNIAGAVAYCNTLESNAVTAGKVWVKGIVCELTKYQYGASYNTASFWLSDDGKTDGDKFEAYSIFYTNNPDCDSSVAFPADGKLIDLGQEIVLYGNLTNYKGTAETASKKAYIVSQK